MTQPNASPRPASSGSTWDTIADYVNAPNLTTSDRIASKQAATASQRASTDIKRQQLQQQEHTQRLKTTKRNATVQTATNLLDLMAKQNGGMLGNLRGLNNRAAKAKTPGDLGALILVLFVLWLLVVQVGGGAGSGTRFSLMWGVITGQKGCIPADYASGNPSS